MDGDDLEDQKESISFDKLVDRERIAKGLSPKTRVPKIAMNRLTKDVRPSDDVDLRLGVDEQTPSPPATP